MANTQQWQDHESATQLPSAKPNITSAGCYLNEAGRPELSGSTIIRKWSSSGSGAKVFITIFALMWNGMISFAIFTGLKGTVTVNGHRYASLQEAYQHDSTTLIFLLFPLVGILMAYLAVGFWINRTTISIKNNSLSVERGPLPWFTKPVLVPANEVKQCFVQIYCAYQQNNQPIAAYRVVARNNTNQEMIIEQGIRTYEDARILEQWIERNLSISDQAVEGEAVS